MSRVNPLAPPAYNGLSGAPGPFVDVNFVYPYTVTLSAGEFLRDQVLSLATDADFVWRALVVSSYTGAFAVRFSDSQGYYLSNGMLNYSTFLQGTVNPPWPIFPDLVLPAGGKIGIDIQDLSNSSNVIELAFLGVKRYRVG